MEEQKKFHFPDNTSIDSVDGLRDKIETISYDVFYHHVSESKNDFASWVRHVLKDSQLADNLENARSIVETVEVLNDYLHPSNAQRHLEDLDDLQSRIEHDVLSIKSFEEKNGASEQMQTPQTPPPKIKQEKLVEIPDHFDDDTQEDNDQEEEPEVVVEAPLQTSAHYKRQDEEKKEISQFHHDVGTLIVKDFIWGFIFGLVIGIFLMKLFAL